MNSVSETFAPPSPVACQHVVGAAAAVICAALMLAGVQWWVQSRLPVDMAAFAARPSPIKLTGNVLQTAAFRLPGILPIFGSSELDHPADNRPDEFFRARPTGFAAFPIGRGGTTSLMMLQKIAAAGTAASGKKAVIFLSPSWFAREEVGENAVDANLTSPQLSAWCFGGALSATLRQKISRRLLDYPDSIKDEMLLADAVRCAAEPTLLNRVVFTFFKPLGWMQNFEFQRIEYCAILREMLWRTGPRSSTIGRGGKPVRTMAHGEPDWARLAAQAEDRDRAQNDGAFYSATNARLPRERRAENIRVQAPGSRDEDFATKVVLSKEFDDLRLLTEVLKELKVDALFISQPFNGLYRNLGGTTRRSRQVYYDKLAATLADTGFPLLDFNDHEEDRFFFNDANHPSAKAWIYYNQGIDRFYHQASR